MEPGSAGIYLGEGARIGKLDVSGNVAGRDVVVGAKLADAAAEAGDRQQLLEILKQLEEQVAALHEAPSGLRSDTTDELRKAREAGEQGDADRLGEKLETARSYLERIGQALPAALTLAQAVAAIATRAAGLW
jgi:hypothetical protein